MTDQTDPSRPSDGSVAPSEGWAVLHLFTRASPGADRAAVEKAVAELGALEPHHVVPVAVLGHKADLGFMAVGPDLWRLQAFERAVRDAGLDIVWSYLSLTELSEYSDDLPERMKEMRLHPRLPPKNKPAFCFYPMTKRRAPQQNWYALPYDERKRLMLEHGSTGRTFAGRVLQVVTGSTGVDDWEWGVTLFAEHPDDLKDVVYTMRYDEASAVYAEFGPFYTGLVDELTVVLDRVL